MTQAAMLESLGAKILAEDQLFYRGDDNSGPRIIGVQLIELLGQRYTITIWGYADTGHIVRIDSVPAAETPRGLCSWGPK